MNPKSLRLFAAGLTASRGTELDSTTIAAVLGFVEGMAADGRSLTITSRDGDTVVVLTTGDAEYSFHGDSLAACLTRAAAGPAHSAH